MKFKATVNEYLWNTSFDSESCLLSQDTIMALQALSTYTILAWYMKWYDVDLTIRVSMDASSTVASFHIDRDNYQILQSRQVLATSI